MISPEDWANINAYLPPRDCTTALNGTGARCTCDYDCLNYWMRARGAPKPAGRTTDIPFRDRPWRARLIERLYRWTHGGQIRTLVVRRDR